MKCIKCNKREGLITIPSLEQKACRQCFSEIIEKRFNKNMRINYPDLNKVCVSIKRQSDKIFLYLLRQREKKSRNLKVSTGKSNIPQYTLDDVAVSVIKSFLNGKNYMIRNAGPLGDISEKELKEYAEIKKLKFTGNPRKGEDKGIHELILKLDERRPGVMYSIKHFKDKLNASSLRSASIKKFGDKLK